MQKSRVIFSSSDKEERKQRSSQDQLKPPPVEKQDQAERHQESSSPKELRKLEQLAGRDEQILAEVSSVFPFTLFPDSIMVTRTRVTVNYYMFFMARQVHSVLIDDLMMVEIVTSPFFAAVHLVDKRFPGETIKVQYLPKEEARKVHRVVQGLLVAHQEKVDLEKVANEDLIPELLRMGEVKSIEEGGG